MCSLSGAVVSSRKGFDGAEPVARLGLLLSDTAASYGDALKELLQLVKLGLLLHDAVGRATLLCHKERLRRSRVDW